MAQTTRAHSNSLVAVNTPKVELHEPPPPITEETAEVKACRRCKKQKQVLIPATPTPKTENKTNPGVYYTWYACADTVAVLESSKSYSCTKDYHTVQRKIMEQQFVSNGAGQHLPVVVFLQCRYVPANNTGRIPDTGPIGYSTDTDTSIRWVPVVPRDFIGNILARHYSTGTIGRPPVYLKQAPPRTPPFAQKASVPITPSFGQNTTFWGQNTSNACTTDCLRLHRTTKS